MNTFDEAEKRLSKIATRHLLGPTEDELKWIHRVLSEMKTEGIFAPFIYAEDDDVICFEWDTENGTVLAECSLRSRSANVSVLSVEERPDHEQSTIAQKLGGLFVRLSATFNLETP